LCGTLPWLSDACAAARPPLAIPGPELREHTIEILQISPIERGELGGRLLGDMSEAYGHLDGA
jgi:hypothetical protein